MAILSHHHLRRARVVENYGLIPRPSSSTEIQVSPNASLTEYLSRLMPGIEAECESENCMSIVPVAQMVTRDGRRFCTAGCADRTLAPMIKPQPKGTQIEGWDV